MFLPENVRFAEFRSCLKNMFPSLLRMFVYLRFNCSNFRVCPMKLIIIIIFSFNRLTLSTETAVINRGPAHYVTNLH